MQHAVADQLAQLEEERQRVAAQETAASQLQRVLGVMWTELSIAAADAAEPRAADGKKGAAGKKK